ncbi:hypothetical protein Gotur_007013, partial [Gossypium turneri]
QTTSTYTGREKSLTESTKPCPFSSLIRDEIGKWILGYNRFLGKSSVFIAQLWGILDGLLLLQKQWHDRVLILFDNLEFVRHIPRENNQAPNILTKMAFANKVELYLFDASPLEIQEILEEDVARGALSPGSTL